MHKDSGDSPSFLMKNMALLTKWCKSNKMEVAFLPPLQYYLSVMSGQGLFQWDFRAVCKYNFRKEEKTMLKKSLALLLVLATVGVLAGCGNAGGMGGSLNVDLFIPDVENYVTPNFNGETLNLYMAANSDFEAEGCYADEVISKTLNLNLVFHELDSFDSQYNPMLAEGEIPSLTVRNSWTNVNNQLGVDGAMVNILEPDILAAMPHVKAFLEQTPEGQQFIKDYSYKEGVLYGVPMIESGTAACYGYLYRKDVFNANDMEFPTTQDEFYNALMKLKSLYPNSYPFVMRGMSGWMQSVTAWGYNWGIGHQIFGIKNSIFTLQNNEYIFAPITESYKEMISYINKLMGEGLMHPSGLTMDTSGWTEAFASNVSFISFDKMDRLPALNLAGTQMNPDFRLVGTTGIPMGTNGRVETQAMDKISRVYMIGANDQLATTLQYVDWLYSEEGIAVTNWGIEGESYTVDEKGEKHLNLDFINQLGSYNATGFGMGGVVGYKDFNSYLSACDEEMAASVALCLSKATADPQILLAYEGNDQLIIDTYAQSCGDYAMSQLSKFMVGQRNISEWDAYANELSSKYHLNELQKAHENAYQAALQR